jgi:preprotein translocase subunit SecG
MGFLIGLLTVVMVLDCAALILLVLIQLPKKDAGAGLAFGGGATDALFGAGSGNVLTKITKYAATIFFVLSVTLSVMQGYYHNRTASVFEQKIQQASMPLGVPATSPAAKPAAVPGTNALAVPPAAAENTNLPIAIPAPSTVPPTTPK